MGLYLRNNLYYYKRQIDNRTYYVALKLRRGQESLLSSRVKQVEEETLAKHFGLPTPSKVPIGFADYCYKYLDQKKHKKTFDRDRQRLLKVIGIWGNLNLSVISKMHIKKLEEELFRLKRKSTTINRYFELLSHLFNLAIEDRYLKENPCKYYQRFVEDYTRRSLTKPELTRILKVALSMQKKPKNNIESLLYDLMLVGLCTGMRLSEILFLKREYINRNIIVYPISLTKYRRRLDTSRNYNKVKIIYINKIVKNIISKYTSSWIDHPYPPLISPPSPSCNGKKGNSPLDVKKHYIKHNASPHMAPLHGGTPPVTNRDKKAPSVTLGKSPLHSVTLSHDGYVFPVKWRNPNAIFRTVRIIRIGAKVPDFCFHQLRHTVSSWVAASSSLFIAKTILGHADIRTTLRYAHPEIGAQQKGIAKIEADIMDVIPK